MRWDMYTPELEQAMLKGLSAVHKMGVAHKDFGPGNILIAQDQTVKVIDLGNSQTDPLGYYLYLPQSFHVWVS